MRKKNIYNVLRKSLLLAVMACGTLTVSAVPAKPGLVRTLQLVDGTTVTARLVGDEFGHYWLANDGKAYQADASGRYFAIDASTVKAQATARRSQVNAQRAKRLAAPRKVGSVGNYTGQKKGLIILVNFKDVAFSSKKALWENIANKKNYVSGNFKGSMYDYFYAQSDGKFELTFDVVGPVTVSQDYSFYGRNKSNGDDMHPAQMVCEACKLAKDSVNYADYDWDNDGYVDQVYVVYAGKGEADGGTSNTIWPHAWSLETAGYYGDGDGILTLDGKKVDSYACGGELNGSSGAVAGPGTMCHEFSHCLGYPDFYDTDYSGGQGMGNWDLMDSGSYNGDGYQPAGYTGYERWVAGWKEPIELTYSRAVTGMKPLQEGGEFYIIYNSGNRNEYFMFENRQKVGWDASLPGKGLLIIHADYNANVWNNNGPNDDPSHQRMTWIPADNEYQYFIYDGTKYFTEEGMANDPFPYGTVKSFNASTTPAAKFYNKTASGSYYMDSSIENITQNSNHTISFNFKGLSNVAPPTFTPEPGQYDEPVLLKMSSETGTIYYTTDGTTPTTSSTPYTHTFYITENTTVKAIAVSNGQPSEVVTAEYTIGAEANTFKLVKKYNELESGKRYIIAAGDYNTAAGPLKTSGNASYLTQVPVTLKGDSITLEAGSDVLVFTLEGSGNKWSVKNSVQGYLYSNATKSMIFSNDKPDTDWTMENQVNGVIMKYGSYGTLRYNIQAPRFTTYTNSSGMAYANLYMEVPNGKKRLVGDANGDGEVNVSDATITVQHILTNLSNGFVFYNADVNEDCHVIITDVTAIVGIILGM